MMSPEILYVALGWLFGLVSSLVLESNRRARLVKSLRRGLRFELSEAERQLAGVVWNIATKLGTADRELLEWVIAAYERYAGEEDISRDQSTLRALLEDPRALSTTFGKKWSILRHFPTPALDAAVAAISDFPENEQVAILQLRMLCTAYNGTVDDSGQFHRMTFDVPAESHEAALNNLKNAQQHVAKLGRKIVDRAERYLRATA